MKKFLVFLLSLVVMTSFAGFASADVISLPNPLCAGAQGQANPCVPSPTCVCGFRDLLARVSTFIFSVIGVLAVLMFVIAGILFVISAGDAGKVQKAKDMAIWAAIGVVVAFAGQGLIALVTAVIGA